MTNEEYWKIADEHEEMGKDGEMYVPRKNCKSLVESIVKANKKDYYETVADLDLFYFGSEKKIKYCVDLAQRLCRR